MHNYAVFMHMALYLDISCVTTHMQFYHCKVKKFTNFNRDFGQQAAMAWDTVIKLIKIQACQVFVVN